MPCIDIEEALSTFNVAGKHLTIRMAHNLHLEKPSYISMKLDVDDKDGALVTFSDLLETINL